MEKAEAKTGVASSSSTTTSMSRDQLVALHLSLQALQAILAALVVVVALKLNRIIKPQLVPATSLSTMLWAFCPVQIWHETYETCIQNCLDCVIGHDVPLTQLREKWLHIKYAIKPAMIDTFMNATYKHLIALCHSTLVSHGGM
ncbi:hypothetical protein O181_119218 [Austropuccinia psidii MF-1]|uniref:Uncharacterized protein n=1 Tax=Austropuccinia psidii MF-1 TaxID=1389203 RepID=A0A9Q3KDP5_9BASI|nr:hypothetical protein [Austropuccinia psidii MF-1]